MQSLSYYVSLFYYTWNGLETIGRQGLSSVPFKSPVIIQSDQIMYLQPFSFFLHLSFSKEKSLFLFFLFLEKERFQATFSFFSSIMKFAWLFSSTSFLLHYKTALHTNSISHTELLPEGNACCSGIPYGKKDEEVAIFNQKWKLDSSCQNWSQY